jgi:hypothetical protein
MVIDWTLHHVINQAEFPCDVIKRQLFYSLPIGGVVPKGHDRTVVCGTIVFFIRISSFETCLFGVVSCVASCYRGNSEKKGLTVVIENEFVEHPTAGLLSNIAVNRL